MGLGAFFSAMCYVLLETSFTATSAAVDLLTGRWELEHMRISPHFWLGMKHPKNSGCAHCILTSISIWFFIILCYCIPSVDFTDIIAE
jgi:hypothetical protein